MLLFVGAGASNPFEIPTMSEFVNILSQKFCLIPLYKDIMESFENTTWDLEVLMTVLDDLSKSKQDFFNSISPQTAYFLYNKERKEANQYVNNERFKEKAKDLLTEIKKIIRQICVDAVRKNETKIINAYDIFFKALYEVWNLQEPKPWGNFSETNMEMNFPSNLRFFTTNYDTCIEIYLNRKQLDFSRGIVNRFGDNVFDVNSYNDGANKIGVYKLHGSIDLFQKGDQIRQSLPIVSDITDVKEEFGEESLRWPIEFGGYRHIIESPYLDLFRLLRDRAREDQYWIIIGSSLRDRTICSILNDVLRLRVIRERPKVVLLDIEPNQIVNRLRDWGYDSLADTIMPIKTSFGSDKFSVKFISSLIPNYHT
ncbi:MAG: SIR2 family protein [Candidatus Bathyarchaeota archaeon]|nr:MAG: SIR2 family protein [Candidatus Bathyarchaeota archaeon]